MSIKSIAAALIAGSLFSTTALAQELVTWGASDYWDVLIDPSLGNGCLIQSEFEDGSLVRIGLDRTTGSGYVTVFNTAWGDIEEGGRYAIDFTLDGDPYTGEAKGIYLNDVPGADIEFDNVDFFMSIAQRQTMTMYNDGLEVLSIDLTGTMAGLDAVLSCQDEQG
tara:strand:+ start:493 stop:987 length:495 start_codon:yes stop_codon:yes gene_type:complete